jgi:hypothetical protein
MIKRAPLGNGYYVECPYCRFIDTQIRTIARATQENDEHRKLCAGLKAIQLEEDINLTPHA